MNVYADESCKNERNLALGGIAMDHAGLQATMQRLVDIRAEFNTWGEVKWTKTSQAKLSFYKAFVDVFFDAASRDEMHFHCLYVDTGTFQHGRYSGGDRELGFNKLIYQLLLHKFGCRYGKSRPMHVYLDQRTTKHKPEEIRPMLNADLIKRHGITNYPFRRITFQDSKSSDIMQLNDLLVGVVGYKVNRHDRVPGCSQHKVHLANYMLDRVRAINGAKKATHRSVVRFTVWPFAYKIR